MRWILHIMDQWLYSISDHCFEDLTNYKQNCYSSIVDGIVFASDVKRCTLSYFASVSSSETMDRWGWQYGSKDWGWSIGHNMCVSIRSSLPPAPDELLKTIYCRCKTNCDSKRCNCRKHGLECSVACTECRGNTCSNLYDIRIFI